jgi:thiol-disulfide isomerase/thioredoxin
VSTGPGAGLLRGVGLLLLCGVGGFLTYWALRPHPAAIYPASRVTGPQVPPPPQAQPIPQELPSTALARLDGIQGTLQDFRGRLLVVNFWATWCEPCRREVPLLDRLRREHVKDGLEIVGIAIDHAKDVQEYVQKQKISYPVLIGEKGGLEMVQALGMDMVLPFSVFADRQGQIVALKVGELHPQEADLILGRLIDLDLGRLDIATARREIAAGIQRLSGARAAQTSRSSN